MKAIYIALLPIILCAAALVGCVQEGEIKPENRIKLHALDTFGIELAIPQRWEVTSQDIVSLGGSLPQVIVFADSKKWQTALLYREITNGNMPIEQWVGNVIMPSVMESYSKPYGYTLGASRKSTAPTASNQTAGVWYQDVTINNHQLEMAFGFIRHGGNDIVVVIKDNVGGMKHKWVLEEAFLKGIKIL